MFKEKNCSEVGNDILLSQIQFFSAEDTLSDYCTAGKKNTVSYFLGQALFLFSVLKFFQGKCYEAKSYLSAQDTLSNDASISGEKAGLNCSQARLRWCNFAKYVQVIGCWGAQKWQKVSKGNFCNYKKRMIMEATKKGNKRFIHEYFHERIKYSE